MLKPEHSLAWNNMVILLDNTGMPTALRGGAGLSLLLHKEVQV